MTQRPPNPMQKTSKQLQQPVYYPSVFHYKCRGALHLTTDQKNSAGLCRGIQSRLEHVKDLNGKSTFAKSIEIFEQAAGGPQELGAGSSSLAGLDEGLLNLIQSPALVYQPDDIEKKTKQEEAAVVVLKKHSNSKQLQEETTTWHDWSCYGSTDVHLLVLRDAKTNEEHIAGVAPDCKVGISLRDVGTGNAESDTIYTVGSLRLGFLEISLAEVGESTTAPAPSNHQKANQQINEQEQQPHTARPYLQGDEPAPVLNNAASAASPEDQQQKRPSRRSRGEDDEMSKRMWESGGKILASMKQNAIILGESLSDGFPSRMYNAGGRILAQCPKTLDRTTKVMGDVYKMWRGDDSGDDDYE